MRKKFSNYLIGIVILLLILSAPVLAEETNSDIAVTKVISGTNTKILEPAGYLIDNNKETNWGFTSSSRQGWAELTLKNKALINGLEVSGFLGKDTELFIEYKQDNHWIPFFASSIKYLTGEKLIDLSYDQIVTNKLRLRLIGSGVENSQLREIRVLGESPNKIYQRIPAQNIIASENTAPTSPAELLADGNTYTMWQVEPNFYYGNGDNSVLDSFFGTNTINDESNDDNQETVGKVIFELEQNYHLNRINIYFTKETTGDFRIEVEKNDGSWQEINQISGGSQQGWYQLDLNQEEITTDKVRLVVSGYNEVLGGISEVEFFGYGSSYRVTNHKLIGIQRPKELKENINRYFTLKSSEVKDYYLELAVEEETNEPLVIEINGEEMTLQPTLSLQGHTIYHQLVEKDNFWEGDNFLKVKASSTPLTLVNARITRRDDVGRESHSVSKLDDNLLLTPAGLESGTEIVLNQKTVLEEVEIYSKEDNPNFYLYAWVDGSWMEVYQADKKAKSMKFRRAITTNRLRIENPNDFSITEVSVKGSAVTDKVPTVEILNPQAEEIVPIDNIGEKKLIGFVDNPNSNVVVNGLEAEQKGHYFWVKLMKTGVRPWKIGEVVAVAEDKRGRKSSDEIKVLIGEKSFFSIDQPDKLVYTIRGSFKASGSIKRPLNSLKINDKLIETPSGYFSRDIELQEGFNLIKIQAAKEEPTGDKKFVKSLYRRVFYYNDPIELTVNSPLSGYYTDQREVVVTGNVDGLGGATVKVNGQKATVNGMYYISQPVNLVEGKNLIKIEASDELGEIEKEIIVYHDTTPPSIEGVLPTEDYLSASSSIEVSGKIIDKSPVWVYVNDQAVNQSGEVFNKQLTFLDGGQLIKVKAVDMAGNIAEHKINITVDTTPPEDFEVVADPADWTNNTQPIVTFATNDQTSGVSHYEMAINDGEFQEVVSPHQLISQPDGEHTVRIKAVDNAGWETLATTKIYIDTTPPQIPPDFRAVSDDDRALIRWQPSEEDDVVEYRIKRSPAWKTGEYKVVSADDEIIGGDNFEFIDEEVTKGEEYTYYLQAIDHADNYGELSNSSTIKIGITNEPIDPNKGGRVEYGGATIQVSENSIPAEEESPSIRVESVPEEIKPKTENNVVSKTYSFNLVDENQQVKEPKFEEPVEVTLGYDEESIPEGYSVFDLNVYYYSEAEGRWISFDRKGLDLEEREVTIETDHFSMYNVQVTKNYSPSADKYKDLGISPYQSYFKNNQEHVSPANGSLTIKATDIKLSGRNGLDLEIGRIFDSSAVTMERLKKEQNEDDKVKGYPAFGVAWNINLPWIEKTDKGTFIHFGDGSAYKIEWEMTKDDDDVAEGTRVAAEYYYHEGRHFYAKKYMICEGWISDIFGFEWEEDEETGYTITTKDGTKYSFNNEGQLTEKADRTGENKISYHYSEDKIDYIKDSVDRKINFKYSGSKIVEIIVGNRSYTYSYNDDKLTGVTDPEGRETGYTYTTRQLKVGNSVGENIIYDPDIPLVQEITYPTGGRSYYEYDEKVHGVEKEDTYTTSHIREDENGDYKLVDEDGDGEADGLEEVEDGEGDFSIDKTSHDYTVYNYTTILVKRHYQLLNANTEDNWNKILINIEDKQNWAKYNYTLVEDEEFFEDGTRSESNDENFISDGSIITHTTIEKPKQKIKMEFDKEDRFNTKKVIKDKSGNELERYEYQYDQDLKTLLTEKVFKDGSEYPLYGKYYDYDNWGNVIYSYHSGTGLKTKSYYYNTNSSSDGFEAVQFSEVDVDQANLDNSIHTLLAGKIVYNTNLRDGEIKEESTYRYSKNGNLLLKAQYHQDEEKWLKTRYSYDKWGNVLKKIDPKGNITEKAYSDEYSNAYLTMVKKYGAAKNGRKILENIDDEDISAIVHRYGYDFSKGLKSWEIDPEGYLTEYDYDSLKRLTKIVYPQDGELIDSNSTDISTLENKIANLDRSDNPVKIQFYDDSNNVTTVVNATKNIGVNSSKVTNEKLSDPIYNKSKYKYDALNRWIELKQYLKQDELMVGQTSPFVTQFKYDKVGNKIETIDAEGKSTKKEYDALNRVTKISYDDNTYTQIEYNDKENSRTITDPEKNRTIEVKDWGGNVVQISKFNDGVRYTSSALYDALGNKIMVTDGNGRTTDLYYNDLNQLVKKKLPKDQYLVNDQLTIKRPIITYEYDDNGNKTAETNSKGNITQENDDYTTKYEYDALDRMIKIIDPAGNVTKKYYNNRGKEVKVVKVKELDNNEEEEVSSVEYVYDSRGNKIVEIDGKGNAAYYEYDIIGKRVEEYDPRGVIVETNENGIRTGYTLDKNYKIASDYDSLGRLIKTSYPEIDGNKIAYDKKIKYDKVGNKKKVITGNKTVEYLYDDSYNVTDKIITTSEGSRSTSYTYDDVGNKLTVTNPQNQTTEYVYDDLYRKIEVIKPDGSTTEYDYDRVGNKIWERDGNGNVKEYEYNAQDKLVTVYEPGTANPTEYQYDLHGNLMKKIMSNGLQTEYKYNQLDQRIKEIKPGDKETSYTYNIVGNLKTKINPRKIKEEYIYYMNGQVDQIKYYQKQGSDGEVRYTEQPQEITKHEYDQAGNRVAVKKYSGSIKKDNLESSILQTYDQLGRIASETRTIGNKSYTTQYNYDKYGNLIGIKYPESNEYLNYGYDDFNQLEWIEGIAGDKANPAFEYNDNGQIKEMGYDNGVYTTFTYDANSRVDSILTTKTNIETGTAKELLNLEYTYDGVGNITSRNDNQYDYDQLNRLKSAEVDGDFYLNNTGDLGYTTEDYYGNKGINVTVDEIENITLDYSSGSVGVSFAQVVENITKVELKTVGDAGHRLSKRTMDIYYSSDNTVYTKLAQDSWKYERDHKGNITVTIPNGVSAKYLKVHSKFDDRNVQFEPINQGKFTNSLKDMITVYRREEHATLSYDYDSVGNRLTKNLTASTVETTEYTYYEDTNRLLTNGKYAYVYDQAGNLIKKGNNYSINGDEVTFTATSGDEVEYWEYEYNLQGRLTKVDNNGELIAEFSYDADDNRIRTIEYGHEGNATTTNFIYNVSGKVMLEEKVEEDKFTSYIFAFNKHYAKVDGIVGVSTEITYFHYDNVGSTRVMTNQAGEVVMDQDYLPFGGNLAKPGQIEVLNETGEEYKFTGQKEVASIGLYYYGARYYDPSIGRFTREDSYKGELDNPQTQHLYVYVTNNPLRYVDPTGHSGEDVTVTDAEDIDYTIESGDTLSDIAEEYYGSPDYAELIAETNPNIDDPDKIIAGDQIILPQVQVEKDIISNNSFNTLSKPLPNQNNIVMGPLKETNLIPVQNAEALKDMSNNNLYDAALGTSVTTDNFINARYDQGYAYLDIEGNRTFNLQKGTSGYQVNLKGNSVTFSSPNGENITWLRGTLLNASVRLGQKFKMQITDDTIIDYSASLDKEGLKFTITADNKGPNDTHIVDNLDLRPGLRNRELARQQVITNQLIFTTIIMVDQAVSPTRALGTYTY